MGNFIVNLIVSLIWPVYSERKHKHEIASLKRANKAALQECGGTVMLSRMIILFLGVVLLLAYWETA